MPEATVTTAPEHVSPHPHQAPVQGLGLPGFSPEQGHLVPRPHVLGAQGRGVGLTSGGPHGRLEKIHPGRVPHPQPGSGAPGA